MEACVSRNLSSEILMGLAFTPYLSKYVCNLCGLHTPDFVLQGNFINHCIIATNNGTKD